MTESKRHIQQVPISRLSNDLLDHDGLMTPIMKSRFGEIYAVQHATSETDEIYSRTATVYQKSSSLPLLDAELAIVKSGLDESVFDSLRNTTIAFGQILINHGIDAHAHNRVLFEQNDVGNSEIRYGRRHSIVATKTGITLCHVEELLVPESKLFLAQKCFGDGYLND